MLPRVLIKRSPRKTLAGKRLLLPRAAVARDLIPAELAKLGAQVDVVEAYRNVVPANATERAREVFRGR